MYRRVLLQIAGSIGSAVKVDAVTTSGTRERLVGHKIDQCNQSNPPEQTAARGKDAEGGRRLCYRDWHERRTWATVRALSQSPTRSLLDSRFGATSVHSSSSPQPTEPAPATLQPGESRTKRAFAFSCFPPSRSIFPSPFQTSIKPRWCFPRLHWFFPSFPILRHWRCAPQP